MLWRYRRALPVLIALTLGVLIVPASSDVTAQPAPVEVTQLCRNIFSGKLRWVSPAQSCTPGAEFPVDLLNGGSYTICASFFGGAMRVPPGGGCGPGELTINVPDDLPIFFCINGWTGALRYVYGPTTCNANEFLGTVNQPPPVLEDDAYDSLGNVGIEVANVVDGLFDNDNLEGGTLDTFDAVSANGGAVLVNADGTFEYTPPPGFEGDDTFTYTVTNPGGSDTATVTITVAEVIWFIRSTAPGPGNGTIIDPFNTIGNYNGAADDPGDTIFLYEGNYPIDTFAGLQNDQQLIGQGVDLLTVTGFAPPPFSRPLPGATAHPVITPVGGSIVPVANNNLITGLALDGGANGIAGLGGATGTTVDRVSIANMTNAGIVITPSTNTTITNMQFSTNAADVLLNADTTVIQDVVSTGSGTGISVTNIVNTLLIERADIDNPGSTGILLDAAQSGSTTTINDATVDGGAGEGFRAVNSVASSSYDINNLDIGLTTPVGSNGITIHLSGGTFDFDAASSVTDSGIYNFNLTGGTANVTYNGNMMHNAGANETIFVDSHSVGTVTFQTGSISATSGPGIEFNSADGTYNFNGTTWMSGGDAGIEILGDSNGVFTFGADTDILLRTIDAFNVTGVGTNSPAITYSGTMANNANDVIEISNTAGPNTITFDSVIVQAIQDTAGGTGIYLNGTGQTVNFIANIDLAGVEGIDIDGGTGTFTFTDTDITDTSVAPAVDVNAGSSTFVFEAASSIIQNQNQSAVIVANGHAGGNSRFSGTINATNGDGLQFDNADGTQYNFNGSITLNGGDAGLDIVNGSSGVFTFSNLTVTDPSTGPGVNITGGTTTSTFTQLDVDTTNTIGFNVDGATRVNVGPYPATVDTTGAPALILSNTGLGATFISVSSTNSPAEGIRIQNITPGSTFTIDDGNAGDDDDLDVTLSGDSGVEISSSSGTFTFAGVDMDAIGFDGFHLFDNVGATININAGSISGTSRHGIHSDSTGSLNIGTTAPSGISFGLGGLSPITANAIDVRVAGTNAHTLSILNNSSVAAPLVEGMGVDISVADSATLTATLSGNDIRSMQTALLTRDNGVPNQLIIAVNDNVWESGTSLLGTLNPTVRMDGSGLHSTIVTSLSGGGIGNTIIANGTGRGMFLNRITFDSDANTGNGFQQVDGGVTNVGQGTGAFERVQGDGLSLAAPTGDLNFTTLNIFNNAGTGFEVDTKTLGTAFALFGGGSGTINSAGGPAMFLDPVTTGLTFGSITSTDSATGAGPSNGTGLTLDQVAGTLDITMLTVTNPTNEGLFVNGSTGTFTINGGGISGAGAAAVRVDNVGAADTSTLTYNGSITSTFSRSVQIENKTGGTVNLGGTINDTGLGVLVENNSGGTAVDFDGATKTLNTGANQAVTLTNNGGATINFTNGGLDIDTTSGTGFNATGGGTVTVTGTSNSVASTTGTAITIANTTIGAQDVTFKSVAKDGGTVPGIVLTATGAGDFVVTGDGSAGSGGTIENITNSDAVRITNTGGLVSFTDMVIEDIVDSDDATDAINTRSGVDAIHGEMVAGGLRLDGVTIRRISDNAINGSDFSDGISPTTWAGLQIIDSTLELTNRFNVANVGDDGDEGVVRINGLTGVALIQDSTFQDGGRGLDLISSSAAGTLDVTIQGSTFEDLYKEFPSGGTINVGGRGVSIVIEGSHDAVVRIGDPAEASAALGNTFTNNFTASIVVAGQEGGLTPHTGDIDVVISQNDFIVTDHTTSQAPPGNLLFNFPQGGVSLNPAGGTYGAIVSNNHFDQVMHAAGGFGQLTLGLNGGAVEAIVRGNTFELPWDAAMVIRAEGTSSAAVLVEDNTWISGLVGGPADDVGFSTQSPFQGVLVNVRNGGQLDLTIRDEDLPLHDNANSPTKEVLEVEVQNQAGNVLNLHLENNTAPWGYGFTRSNGAFNLYQGLGNLTDTPQQILDANGNTGGGGNPATDPPTVVVSGTITISATAPTLPSITIS